MWPSGFLAMLRGELYAVVRSVTTYLALLTPVVLVKLRLLFEHFAEQSRHAQSLALGEEVDFEVGTAYGHAVDGMLFGFAITAFVYLTFSAWTFANDCTTGVIRHALILRSSRFSYLCAKFAILYISIALALVLVVAGSFAISGWFWEFSAVIEDGYEIIGETEMQSEINTGITLALLPFLAVVPFALCIAVWSKTPTRAIAITLISAIAFDLMKAELGTISMYFYQSYMPFIDDQSYLSSVSQLVRGFADVFVDEATLQTNRWVPFPYMIVFMVLAFIGIRKTSL